MASLGFIGLGVMGGRIAKRLLDAGHTVTGYNRTKAKAQWLLDAGMRWADTPRAVAENAEVIFSMVTDTSAVQEIVNGSRGILPALKAGKVYVDMSTIDPDVSRELAEQVAAQGARMLEAPVSGSAITIEQGNLSMMVAGDQATFEQIRPVLLDIAPRVNYVGDNGQALLMKIALNLTLPVQFLAFCEGVLLAEKGGVPRETAVEVFLNSAVVSHAMRFRCPLVVKKEDEVWFNVDMMQKDMLLALEIGRKSGVPMASAALANEYLTAARGLGLAEEDFAAIFEVVARMSGM
ncbi:MAG: NAD(P)-dependent oxidoreductase [Ktedonobacteraceae bacterium]